MAGNACRNVVMTGAIAEHLDLLDRQREAIFSELHGISERTLWHRPGSGIWSIGEHLDHTRVLNCFTRRLLLFWYPLAVPFAWPFRRRPYEASIDNVYLRPGVPNNVGWIWPPKFTPERPVCLDDLHDGLRREHQALRRFYTSRDERLLGHVRLPDPVIGILNLVQWLRVSGWHDAHHFDRVRARLENPMSVKKATSENEADG